MANPWFRAYSEMVDDEKLRLLAFEDRWHFVALLCCKNSGILESNDSLMRRKVAVKLGLDSRELDEVARRLSEVGLIDQVTLQPLNWEERQFQSDSSKERVQKYRERLKKQNVDNTKRHSNVTVTAQDTDTDTDTDINRDQANPYPENPDLENRDKALIFENLKNECLTRMNTPNPEKRDKDSNPHESSLSLKQGRLVKKDISKEIYIDKPSKSKKSFTEFPSNFEVTIEMFDWAVSEGVPDGLIKLETQKFKDYCLSKGAKYKDWLATWRNWMRNSVKYNNYKKIA